MTERRIELSEDIDPIVYYGVNDVHVQLFRNLYPNVKIQTRGTTIKMQGDEADVEELSSLIERCSESCLEKGMLNERQIIDIYQSFEPRADVGGQGKNKNVREKAGRKDKQEMDDVLLYGVNGRTITVRTPNQKRLSEEFDTNDLLFAVGPAGTGKTYTAIALAVRSLKERKIRRIILSRPAVEAGEKLGFLPGDLKEKIDPYLQPLYDALQDMLPASRLKEYLEDGTIQIAPLAYMRGRTLSEAVIILDEAQNTSPLQIKMFLTRMGEGSKIIVTGDESQVDLPQTQRSGLTDAMNVLKEVEGIATVKFDKRDIVRHRLVQRIVEAYDNRQKRSVIE